MNAEDLESMLIKVLNIRGDSLKLTLSNDRYVALVPAPALRKLTNQYKNIEPLERVNEIDFNRQLVQIDDWWEDDGEILTLVVDHVDGEELHCCITSSDGWMQNVLLFPHKAIF